MRLEEELHRLERTQEELALLMVDIDHFKSVNDTYGHLVGDKVLREIACQFKGIIRAGLDVICRFGGEEFAAILTKMSRQEARQIAERLRRACRETDYAKDCGTIHLTVSIGVVTVDASSTGVSAKDLLQRVDTMLYAAKEEGRDQVKEW
jgi:diguanylate cyclase (GGDEF)-like protein